MVGPRHHARTNVRSTASADKPAGKDTWPVASEAALAVRRGFDHVVHDQMVRRPMRASWIGEYDRWVDMIGSNVRPPLDREFLELKRQH